MRSCKILRTTRQTLKSGSKKSKAGTTIMDRMTGWCKSHTVLALRWIAIGLTSFFNINVIRLGKEIFTNGERRGTRVSVAGGAKRQ